MSRFFLALASLAIVAFGQPSVSIWLGVLAALFGYALFWHSINIYPFAYQRFWRAGVWYTAVSLIQLSWMTSIEFQGVYILFVMAGLSVWLGLQFALLTLLIPHNRSLSAVRLLAIASLWTLMEWSRGYYMLCGFSWNPAGLAFSQIFSMQLASVLGVLGLSFWVMLVNLLALRAWMKKRLSSGIVWGAAAAFPFLFGALHLLYHENEKSKSAASHLDCVLVQTGLLPSEKIPLQGHFKAFISPYDQWKRILTYLKEQGRSPQLIVLPEGVVPFSSDRCSYDKTKVERLFIALFGSSAQDAFPEEEGPFVSNMFWTQTLSNLFQSEVVIGLDHQEGARAHNSAFHFVPGSVITPKRYDKRILMPLAEYLPSEWLRPLVKNYGIEDFFTPGRTAQVFQGAIPFAVSICYEETFSEPIRQGRQQGARLLVNVTNDGWYPHSRLPRQHYTHAKMRAVENGVPLIRACNTGVTAAVDSLGREVGRLVESNSQGHPYAGALFTSLDTYTYPTLYLLWGDGGILTLSMLFIFIFVLLKTYPLAQKLYLRRR